MIDLSLDLKAVIAIFALATTIAFSPYFQWWRNRKNLSYEIISNTPLLTAAEEIAKELEVFYKGTPVNDIRILVLKVINNGKQSIKKEDFVKPLSFVFSSHTQILSVETLSVNPNNLEISTTFEGHKFFIEPVLFNSKDFVKLKVLVSASTIQLKVDARIIDVRKVGEIDRRPIVVFSYIMSIFGSLALFITGYLIYISSGSERIWWCVAFVVHILSISIYSFDILGLRSKEH